MSEKRPDIGYLLDLAPRDAAAYLDSLGLVPTSAWTDLMGEARACAFTVAGMTRLDLLTDVHNVLKVALKDGLTMREFRKILAPELIRRGWDGRREVLDRETGEVVRTGPDLSARLDLIYFQNMRQALMAGRYRAMLANADDRPWWMYVAVIDSRTRPAHARLNRRVFRYDDPFWRYFYPPNGFYCRCRVRALDDNDLAGLGLEPEESRLVSREVVVNPKAPKDQRKTATQWGLSVDGGVCWADPGFAWSPGYATWGIDHVLAQKLDYLKDAGLYSQVIQYMNNSKARQAAFATWALAALARKHASGEAAVLGLVQPQVVEKAMAEGLDPARIAVMTDYRLKHADSEGHRADGIALPAERYGELAPGFASPEAIYWDREKKNAVYILPDADSEWCVLLILNLPAKEAARKKLGRYDGIVTFYRERREALRARKLERLK